MKQPEFTSETLAPYLSENLPELGLLSAVEKFSDGQSNPTYKLSCEKGTFVLRAQPPGELLKSAHQVDREYRVMKALGDTFPVHAQCKWQEVSRKAPLLEPLK